MTVYADIIVELELSPGTWTDVTHDVLQAPGISGKQGMMDNAPTTRVAEPGKFSFTLRNDESCTAGINNYYTPGNPNCIAGFQSGIAVRLRLKYAFLPPQTIMYGHIPADGIQLTTGIFTGRVKVEVRDYMEMLSNHEMYLPPFTENKSMPDIVALIVANNPVFPLGTEYNSGENTFATVFDTVRPKTKAITELNKLAISEFGYIYTKPEYDPVMSNPVSDELLVCDGELTRSNEVSLAQILNIDTTESFLLQENGDPILQENGEEILIDIAATQEDAIFDDSMGYIETSHARNYYNMVRAIIAPRRVDVAATTVLYSNPNPFFIAVADGTKVIKGNFRDPENLATNVTCAELTVPVAGTDYKFTENEDGSGADLTASAGFSYVVGAEGIEYTFNPIADGWVYILQARGKGVYLYDKTESTVEDTALTATDGERMLTLDMKYRDSPIEADIIAPIWLSKFKQKDTLAEKASFVANRSEFLMMAFIVLQVGDKVWAKNTRTDIDAAYFINGKEFNITEGGIIHYSYILCPAAYDSYIFWELEVAGKSELGVTTWIGI
jgi:hypothetical protein